MSHDGERPSGRSSAGDDSGFRCAIAAERWTDPVAVHLALRRAEQALLRAGENDLELGRYVVLRRLAAGGHGVVYEAHDPQLDRRIALKIQHPCAAPLQMSKDEARALARLSHPNVIAVFDIGWFREVGSDRPARFIAMELVDGCSLRQWSTHRPRSTREVLAIFAQVADGLAAIHAAGLVHRDIKPDNILIGSDGLPKISDLGVACTTGRAPQDGTTAENLPIGTRAFMPPEQLQGGSADPRSDQYAFCVSLRESLPSNHRPSRRLKRILQRGLAQDPEDRYASMHELAAQLRACLRPTTGARLWLPATALLAASVSGVVLSSPDHLDGCEALERRGQQVWTSERRAALQLPYTTHPRQASFAVSMTDSVDEAMNGWRRALSQACSSDAPSDVDLRCLDEGLRDVDHLLRVLEASPSRVDLERAVWAAANLRPDLTCAPQTVQHRAMSEDTPALDELSREAWARQQAGDLHTAAQTAEEALFHARALDQPLSIARALVRAGSIDRALGRADRAVSRLEEAVQLAFQHRADALALHGSAELVHALLAAGQPSAALQRSRHGMALARRTGREHLQFASMLSATSAVLQESGRVREAVEHQRHALEIQAQILGPTAALVGHAHQDLGAAYIAAGEPEAALVELARAETIYIAHLGEQHLQVAYLLHNRATALELLERLAEAEAALRGSMKILHDIDPRHPDLVLVLNAAGVLAYRQSRYEEAVALHEDALKIARATVTEAHPRVADTLVNLGNARGEAGGGEAPVRALYEQALEIYMQTYGTDHPWVAATLTNIANSHRLAGHMKDAITSYEAALEIYERSLGALAPELEPVLTGLALCYEAVGDNRSDERHRRALALAAARGAPSSSR